MSWRIEADLDLCQGHQVCLTDLPEVFGFDEASDKVQILVAHPADALKPQLQTAVQYCPAMALTLVEED